MYRYIWIGLVLALADFVMNVVQAGMAITLNLPMELTYALLPLLCYMLAGAYVTHTLKGVWLTGVYGGLVFAAIDSTLGYYVTDLMMYGRPNAPESSDPVSLFFSSVMLGAVLGGFGGWLVKRIYPDTGNGPSIRGKRKE